MAPPPKSPPADVTITFHPVHPVVTLSSNIMARVEGRDVVQAANQDAAKGRPGAPLAGVDLPAQKRFKLDMSKITEKLPTQSSAHEPSISNLFTSGVDTPYITTTDSRQRDSCAMTAAGAITNADKIGYAQIYSYTATILCTVFPALESTFLNSANQIGVNLIKRIFPACAEPMALTIIACNDPKEALMTMAQAVLIMFRTINHRSYSNFIANEAATIAGLLGLQGDSAGSAVFDLTTASMIRDPVGSQQGIRIAVLTQLMDARGTDLLGRICGYLCGVLAWTDMSGYVFIREALLKTNSPVLAHPSVKTEVEKLYKACLAMSKAKHPQYFRIFQLYQYQRLLEHSNFPTLLQVAHEINRSNNLRVSNYIMPVNENPKLVSELIELHNQAVKGQTRAPSSIILLL